MTHFADLASLLTAYFCNQFYNEGIQALRRGIKGQADTAKRWESVVVSIQQRALSAGQPLELVNYKANQVLDENTDAEAYRWLDLMVQNVQRIDGQIQVYGEVDAR